MEHTKRKPEVAIHRGVYADLQRMAGVRGITTASLVHTVLWEWLQRQPERLDHGLDDDRPKHTSALLGLK